MARTSNTKALRYEATVFAVKNFLVEMDNGATMEKLELIASAADDIALFWHLVGNPEEIPVI